LCATLYEPPALQVPLFLIPMFIPVAHFVYVPSSLIVKSSPSPLCSAFLRPLRSFFSAPHSPTPKRMPPCFPLFFPPCFLSCPAGSMFYFFFDFFFISSSYQMFSSFPVPRRTVSFCRLEVFLMIRSVLVLLIFLCPNQVSDIRHFLLQNPLTSLIDRPSFSFSFLPLLPFFRMPWTPHTQHHFAFSSTS